MDRFGFVILGICIIVAAIILRYPTSPTPPNTGRYQVVPTGGINVLVVDTETGRVWSKVFAPTSGSPEWHEEKTPWNK